MRLYFLTLCFFAFRANAQLCTFDFGNEGWSADGDAVNQAAVFQASGGNPGGYILGTDLSTGGTWYFVASDKFHGIKCDAYGRFLRYDQYVSSNAAPNNKPDIELKGGGITLVFDNPVLPGVAWTHYDVLLREDAGWHINTLTGATPTQAQFRAVLANVSSLKIRGEYFSQAEDHGGLDNVNLESDFQFEFDLDGDDSSGAINGDFQSPATCAATGLITDNDLNLTTNARVDSITLQISGGSALESLLLNSVSGNITLRRYAPGRITLVNNGSATPNDFASLLKLVSYLDSSFEPVSGVRVIRIQVYTDCGVVGETHRAFLPVYTQPYAGLNGDTLLCFNSPAIDLRNLLRDNPDDNGRWMPPLHSGSNIFDPNFDSAGVYTYIVPSAEPCTGDTARVRVRIEYPFQLRPDTTLCYNDTLFIEPPAELSDWAWSDGSQRGRLPVTLPGTYTLTGTQEVCTFSDSVVVRFYSCEVCKPYSPNVFSPNDDGQNDSWHIFLYCRWIKYHLDVYDRWGSLVFAADDPETAWDGRIRGKDAGAGVYVWRMTWSGELFGEPKSWEYAGDVTILR